MKSGPKRGSAKGARTKAMRRAAESIAAGETTEDAATAAGVSPRTIRRWRSADADEFGRMLAEEKQALVGAWAEVTPLALAEIVRRLRDKDTLAGVPLRDLAGLAHLASQHQERCRTEAKPKSSDIDQPHTPAALDALMAGLGFVRKP